jgi:hypothetical protein
VDGVELSHESRVGEEFEGVALDERVWVTGLRVDVNTDDVEPGASVAFAGAALAAVQVEKKWTRCSLVVHVRRS